MSDKSKAPKKKRITHTPKPLADAAEFSAKVNEIAALKLECEACEATLNELLNATGADLRERIDELTAQVDAGVAALHAFAHVNRDTVFPKDRKTADTTSATFGFADNPARIALLSKDWTEETVITALVSLGKIQFVRTVREIDRDGIKAALRDAAAMEQSPDKPADYKPAVTVAELRMCGLKLQQTERFWLEPKRAAETTDRKVTLP